MASLPPNKRLKRSSKTSMDTWFDAFLTLDRFSLDGVQICTRSFRRLTDERLTDVCLRHLDNVYVHLLHNHEGIFKYSAALRSETRLVDIDEPELELFSAKLKSALLPSAIAYLTVRAESTGNIGTAVEIFKNTWNEIQIEYLCVNNLTAYDDPQQCYDFIFAASPQSCTFDFAREKDEVTPPYSCGKERAQSQFFTDQSLRECLAHKITHLSFEYVVPADAATFPLSDDGIVDFLFGKPELKRDRGLTIGYTNASRNIFKRLVQAHLESEIVEDISLDLSTDSFDSQEQMDTDGFDENLLDYGDQAENRCDSSVQYEFPGDIRLQIVLLGHKLLMRRGKRRGWQWMSREEREKRLEENDDFDDWADDGDDDDETDYFFIGHSDYTD